MKNTEIMEKIKKMLALSKNNPSSEEAATALLMAQKLMVKYNLTMEEVEDQPEEAKEAKADYSVCTGANTAWKVRLAKILGNNFRTEVLKCGTGFCFIGMEQEVQLTISLFNLATDIIDKGMKKVRRDARKKGYTTNGLAGDYVSGFLKGLQDKFAEQVEKEGWGLVLVKPEAVVKKTEALTDPKAKPATVSDKLGRRGNWDAFQAGYQAGKNLNSQKQLQA